MSRDILPPENCGLIRGREVYYDYTDGRYYWADTDEPAEGWGGEARPCPQCGELPTAEGYDACLGEIPGATGACCGHGKKDGYVSWDQ